MPIRVEYTVHPLPDSYVTTERIYKYVPKEDDPKVKVRVEEIIEHRGGMLVKFMRGHSIRLFDEAHLVAFNSAMAGSGDKLNAPFQLTDRPRLVDDASGQIVNEQGIPVDIEHLVRPIADGAAADEEGNLFDGAGGDPIEKAIKATA